MNASELRKKFMDEAALPLLQNYINVIQHKDTFNSTDAKAREEMWSLLKHAILSVKDAETQAFQNTNDIIKMVAKGTITAREGKEYLQLLKLKKDVDVVADPEANTDQLGLSFGVEDEDLLLDGLLDGITPTPPRKPAAHPEKAEKPAPTESKPASGSNLWQAVPKDYLE